MLWLLLTGSIIAKNEPKNSNVKIFKMTKISNFGEKSWKIKESNIKTSKSKKKNNKELDDLEPRINNNNNNNNKRLHNRDI